MDDPLDLVFLWHMHQPDYRDRAADRYVLPWTYLHGIKDYTDMADHLERHPGIRAVVNFVPILLDQLDDYARQIESGALRDPLLQLLATDDFETLSPAQREYALQACFRSNHHHMLEPFAPYRRLRDLQALVGTSDASPAYLSGRYYSDLVTWYHLVWFGESVRRHHPWLVTLIDKGAGYTLDDRRRLLRLVGSEITALTTRYRALAERGQIEISTTPYAHPLGPLFYDFGAARDALPDLPLPTADRYPGGPQRFRLHCERARESHTLRFDAPPHGAWPAEGAVSRDVLLEFGRQGFAWAASGEAVLANTLRRAGREYLRMRDLYRPWRDDSGVTICFRDDRLSDLIGFEYSRWDAYDAARHFVGELAAVRAATPAGERPLVCVALDGENAWEYYPYNGYYFFEALYTELAKASFIRTTTFEQVLHDRFHDGRRAPLPPLCAGSWVYGTLTTWIGEADKNRAWDLLCAAKQCHDERAPGCSAEARARAEELLYACEGSDWFWWFGDSNAAISVMNFEQLLRTNLRALYAVLGVSPPAALAEPISHGSHEATDAGTMRRAGGN